jgi:hypothetical protein
VSDDRIWILREFIHDSGRPDVVNLSAFRTLAGLKEEARRRMKERLATAATGPIPPISASVWRPLSRPSKRTVLAWPSTGGMTF